MCVCVCDVCVWVFIIRNSEKEHIPFIFHLYKKQKIELIDALKSQKKEVRVKVTRWGWGQKWLEEWSRGLSGMLLTYSFSIWVLGPWAFLVMKIHQTVLLGHVHFFLYVYYTSIKTTIKMRRTLSWKTLVCVHIHIKGGFPGDSDGKESACNAGDPGSIPGLGRSPGERNGNPLQYSCLENSMDGGAWQAIVHAVAKSRIRLSY